MKQNQETSLWFRQKENNENENYEEEERKKEKNWPELVW